MNDTKICSTCNREKDILCFEKRKDSKDGHRGQCRDCFNIVRKPYLEKNKNNFSLRMKLYREDNKEAIALHKKLSRLEKRKDPNYILTDREKGRANYLKHKVSISNKYKSESYKSKRREYIRKRKQEDINFRINCTLRSRLIGAVINDSKSKSVVRLLGCTIDFFKEYISKQFIEGMSWDNHGEWHIDHIRPCVSFDLTQENQQIICFHYTNMQPLWAKDNFAKNRFYNSEALKDN